MTEQERWQKVEAIVGEALLLPAEARISYLEKQHLDTASLDWALGLLSADDQAADFLEHPVAELIPRQSSPPISAQTETVNSPKTRSPLLDLSFIPSYIGPYKVIRHVCRGGMGDVLLGRRDDGEFERDVALKLLHFYVSSDEALERFKAERQFLANLEHPNIARLYDGGTTPDGRPYLVLEYVEGLEIDEYCARNNLSIEERLELIAQLSEALAYCHDRNLIHRDIKPGNVLVTASGVVKLIDFGIAKDLDVESAQAMTRLGYQPRTSGYASPEQILGREIGQGTDVHAVGILAYELLTGSRLYASRKSSLHEIEKAICDQVAKPASTSVRQRPEVVFETPGGDAFSLRPPMAAHDLTAVLKKRFDEPIAKALRKSPLQRQPDIRQLMTDLLGAKSSATRGYWRFALLALLLIAPLIPHQGAVPSAGMTSQVVRPESALLSDESNQPTAQSEARGPGAGSESGPEESPQWPAATSGAKHSVPDHYKLGPDVTSLPRWSSLKQYRPNIALWPLFSESTDKGDYRSIGLSHEIVDQLARWPELRPLGNRSSWRVATHAISPWRISQELHDLDFFSGRLRHQDSTLDIDLELLTSPGEKRDWSRTWSASPEEGCHLSRRIAEELARMHGVETASPKDAADPTDCHPEAFDLNLKARFLLALHGSGELPEVTRLLERAVELDPDFASAWAALTQTYFLKWIRGETPYRELIEKTRQAALRALELEAAPWIEVILSLSEARLDGNCSRGSALLHDPIAFSIPSSIMRNFVGEMDQVFGHGELLPSAQRATAQDPFNGFALLVLGHHAWRAGEYELAHLALERTRVDPEITPTSILPTHLAIARGDLAAARAANSLERQPIFSLWGLALIEHAAENPEEARRLADVLIENHSATAAYQIAQLFSVFGEIDTSFDWLATARRQKDPGMTQLPRDPYFENLKQDPRWAAVLPNPECPRIPFD